MLDSSCAQVTTLFSLPTDGQSGNSRRSQPEEKRSPRKAGLNPSKGLEEETLPVYTRNCCAATIGLSLCSFVLQKGESPLRGARGFQGGRVLGGGEVSRLG